MAERLPKWRGNVWRTALRVATIIICGPSALIFFSVTSSAAPGDLLYKLTAPDPTPGAGFGRVVAAVDGDILVGEPARLRPALDAPGRAYLFDGQTGKLKLTFDNPEPTDQDVFAHAVAGGDGRVFIATRGVQDRLYSFDAGSGKLLHTILDPDGQGGNFGRGTTYADGSLFVANPSFSLDRDLQVVGRAYLFDGTTGNLQLRVSNPEPEFGDIFGTGLSLAILGDQVAVGTTADDDNNGNVWVFDRSNAQTYFRIANPNPERQPPHFFSDDFGFSVAANEQIIAVGAVKEDTAGVEDSGAVYLFDSMTGELRHTLISPQLEVRSDFGRSIAISPEGNILVGAWGTSVGGVEDAGHAYLFDGFTGSLILDIPNPEPTRFAAFGWSVASSGNRLIIAADQANLDGLPQTGAVYVFETIPEPSSLILTGAVLTVTAIWQGRRLRKKGIGLPILTHLG